MIDVLTTVRNGLPFVREAVASVQSQRGAVFRHFIVDDGSTDGTTTFLAGAGKDTVHVMSIPPVGRGRALNIGWRACNAPYIAILDADDVAAPYWLANMTAILRAQPQIDVLCCRGVLDFAGLDDSSNTTQQPLRLDAASFLDRNPVHHSGTLIRRNALEAVGGYDERRTSLFDYTLWIDLLAADRQIWYVDRGYVYKRIHAGQHFEARRRFHYLRGCFDLRRRVSRELLGGRGASIPYLAFAYGLLPQSFRHWFRYRRSAVVAAR